ncbi:MAG: hypothetical protein KKD07_06915 [Candidatus Omnitrophica bacterium]|nr:hypothetical protein [Candidatus Omnitrophota bacterium]MBU1997782.1 hypothetical protein [Candidatus Omnitrophota bacterium]MBU4334155.1 hypothetical protein [Candidatus Omnitrophota bacterium]
MNRRIFLVLILVLTCSQYCFSQGGIYSLIDPEGKYLNVKQKDYIVKEIIGKEIKDIVIIEYYGGWESKEVAIVEIIKILNDKEIKASSTPLWNMDIPVELVGIIKYGKGSEGKIVVSRHRVGFQDKKGKPWYFQWDERVPDNKIK